MRDQYDKLSPEERVDLKGTVVSWLQNDCLASNPELPVYLKNKVAQVVVRLLQHEFPDKWPTFFNDMISLLSRGPLAADMFCRIIQSLNADVISLEVAKTPEQLQESMRVKDGMRDLCMPQVAEIWYEIAAGYQHSAPGLAAYALETTACTINWIDIGLVVNEKFLTLIFALMLSGSDSRLRSAATECMLEIVGKRMECSAKLELLGRLNIVECCKQLPVFAVEDEDVALKYAELLSAVGGVLLECQNKAKTDVERERSGQQLLEVVPIIVGLLGSDDDVLFSVSVTFLGTYLSKLKHAEILSGPQVDSLRGILAACASKSQFPTGEDFNADPLSRSTLEVEEEVGEIRRELFTIFRNAAGLMPSLAFDLVGNALHALYQQGADAAFQEVEIAVTLLYQLAESSAATSQAMSQEGPIFQLACLLMDQPPPCGGHRLVSLAYMDCMVRYSKALAQHERAFGTVLASFLDQRGIQHPHPGVSSRAAYLFMRLVKVIRQQLLPYLNEIFSSLQPSLEAIILGVQISVWQGTAGEELDDRLYAFEAVGLLLGQEQVPPHQQRAHLSTLISFMCRQLETDIEVVYTGGLDHALAGLRVAYIIQGMSYLSKPFTPHMCRLRPELRELFCSMLALVSKALGPLQSQKLARDRAVSFVHRMVETLDTAVVPYLSEVFQSLLCCSESNDLIQTSTLLVQVLNKLNVHIAHLLELLLPKMFTEMLQRLPEESGGNAKPALAGSEIAREANEVLKAWFSLMHALFTSGCANSLLQGGCAPFLQNVTTTLMIGASPNNPEVSARKTCLQCLGAMILAWCGEDPSQDTVPGFRQFIMDQMLPEVCFRPIIEGKVNAKDAAQSGLIGEMAAMLINLYKRCGESACQYLTSTVLPGLRCPPSLLHQFSSHMASGNQKELRTFLRAMAEQCRICALNGATPP